MMASKLLGSSEASMGRARGDETVGGIDDGISSVVGASRAEKLWYAEAVAAQHATRAARIIISLCHSVLRTSTST